jgi:hypothetical protein
VGFLCLSCILGAVLGVCMSGITYSLEGEYFVSGVPIPLVITQFREGWSTAEWIYSRVALGVLSNIAMVTLVFVVALRGWGGVSRFKQ